jgi:transposase
MICTIVGVSENTLRNYLKDYKEGGIEKLKEIKFNQPKSELQKHKETLEKCFRKTPPATINEAVNRIETITGIKRSPTQVRKFMTAMGMRCLKVGAIPVKADPDLII